jgi:hypothetical protein
MQNPVSQIENGVWISHQARSDHIRPAAGAGTSEMQDELLQQSLLVHEPSIKVHRN